VKLHVTGRNNLGISLYHEHKINNLLACYIFESDAFKLCPAYGTLYIYICVGMCLRACVHICVVTNFCADMLTLGTGP